MDSQLSRSEKKRRAKALEQLVQELASLPPGEIAKLPCDKDLRDEILAAGSLKSGARKRQLKYATKLLREAPVEESERSRAFNHKPIVSVVYFQEIRQLATRFCVSNKLKIERNLKLRQRFRSM